jgi:hypothetical protein
MLLTSLLVIAQAQTVAPQVWEKLIAPGVTYRMEVEPATPMLLHAVRVSPDAEGVLMTGEVATGRVFDPGSPTFGRETVSATAARTGSLVAVNADFFPFTGDPLGAMVKSGELISVPEGGRAAFCWGRGFSQAAYLKFSGSFRFEGQAFPIYGVNQECGDNMVVLNTPVAGFATSREPATHVVLGFDGRVSPVGQWMMRARRRVENATSVQVDPGEVVLTFRGTPSARLEFFNAGDEIELRVSCTGTDWNRVTDVIGGGPFLVKDGKAFTPFEAEGFTAGFANNRHPRTAIGRTALGEVWIVALDGRQTMSAGATIAEMAAVMLRLGCVDAINLDGGGSTTLAISGLTVNRPSEGTERTVANALLVFSGPAAPPTSPDLAPGLVVAGPATLKVGATGTYRLVGADGADVPDSEVLWSAQGAGWIDQSGALRGASEGVCQIKALSRHKSAVLTVTVEKS